MRHSLCLRNTREVCVVDKPENFCDTEAIGGRCDRAPGCRENLTSEIKEILEAEKLQASIYITVDTLKYLKKGGRVTRLPRRSERY